MTRWLLTSLGAWDTIEGEHRHKLTYPLAIVGRVLERCGHAYASWEGEVESAAGNAQGFQVVGIGAMDPRHFWRVAPWLRAAGIADLSAERGEQDPIVIIGGQAVTAPRPIFPFVDVVFVGEAEAGLDAVTVEIDAWRAGRSRRATLEAIAALPGCLVPSALPAGHIVRQIYASGLSISTEHLLSVSKASNPRIEIARGCKGPAGVVLPPERWAACGFCVLGWRRPYQEAPADAVIRAATAVRKAGARQLHLSAGDAEGHSQIRQIREHVDALGVRDNGWTGRLDTIDDCHVQPGKLYAFGVEGVSYRIRRAVGKPRLTEKVIVDGIAAYWKAGGRRLLLHVIGGFPTEGPADYEELEALMAALGGAAASVPETVHVTVGRQPFNPMPHTPMQWFAPGLDTSRIGGILARTFRGRSGAGGGSGLHIVETPGQQPPEAMLNAIAIRGGDEVWPLMRVGAPSLPRETPSARLRLHRLCEGIGRPLSAFLGPLPVDAPLPWSCVQSAFPLETLAREHRRISHILGA